MPEAKKTAASKKTVKKSAVAKTASKRAARGTSARGSAISKSHSETQAVRRYLEILNVRGTGSRRVESRASLERRLEVVQAKVAGADALGRLSLVQERLKIEEQLRRFVSDGSRAALTKAFVASAAAYGQRKGIERAAWREVGVPLSVIKEAGL